MGPSDSAGKKVRAPTISTTETSRPTKSQPLVGKVPGPAGVTLLSTIDPAMANAGMIIRKRPLSMSAPRARLQNGVFAFRPENDEDQHPVHSGADAAEDDLAELDVQQRHQTAQRREAVVHRVDRAAGSVGRDRGEERRSGKSEARLLALEVSAPLLEPRQAVQSGIVV